MHSLTKNIRWPGGAFLRTAVAFIAVLTVGTALSESPRPAAAPLADGLVASLDGVYDIKPSEGRADVRWNVTITNTGPSPFLDADDPRNHPSTVEILVPFGYSNFSATTSSGTPLGVTIEEQDFLGTVAHVQLGYNMPYGDTISFDYSFQQGASSVDGTYISPSYIYLDAFAGVRADEYARALLTLVMPTAVAENASFYWASCESTVDGANTLFTCPDGYADLEVIDESSRISVNSEIDVDGREIDFIIRYWAGDEQWAQRAEKMMLESLPVYAEIFGAPYGGPETIRLSERGGSEIYGALGVAYCQNTICALAATPAADDQVVLHEISHMWSDPFDNRWLTEGIAEYVSLKAAAMLGIPGYEDFADPLKAPQATSRAWQMPESVVTATVPRTQLDPWGGRWSSWSDDSISPQEGYSWGARFWQEIEIRHGPEPFRAVMSEIQWQVPDGTIDSEKVMDLLEDAGGVKADDLFKSYIFPEDRHPILDKRREARDRLAALENRATEEAPELNNSVFPSIESAILDWRFDAALESISELEASLESFLTIRDDLQLLRMEAESAGLSYPFPWEEGNLNWEINTGIVDDLDAAYEAIDAYLAAKADVEAPRSFFQTVGLLGKDDRADLDAAAGHFAWARFDEAIESSQSAQLMISNAKSDGVTYAIILAIVAGSMAIFVAVVYVLSRQPQGVKAAGSEAEG